jgi:dTDP-4-amino-4,6-dideoxygalactose transaminase
MSETPIYIASPFLPDLDEYTSLLKEIWHNKTLTNAGPLHERFRQELQEFLNVDCDIILTNNGTSALEIAIRSLGEFKQFYTTPFSFIATLSAIKWLGNDNIDFVDINPNDFNICPKLFKEQYSSNTPSLSVFTHVFGNSCQVDQIKSVVEQNKDSKIIYDGAHSFNVQLQNKSIFEYGDLSITSFHATKIFHSIEGGAIFSKNKKQTEKIKSLINFGYSSNGNIDHIGTNAKLSEFHAAMGLLNLRYFKKSQSSYQDNYKYLQKNLDNNIKFQAHTLNQDWNYSYCPIVLPSENMRDHITRELTKKSIIPRSYFSPSLNTLFDNNDKCENSENLAKRILCIPNHPDVSTCHLDKIIEVTNRSLNG